MGSERRYALLIGNSEYNDNVLKQLIAPGKDAQSLADILQDPEIGGYEVQLLFNEPDYKIKEQIQVFFQNRKREDILLLYFSCHGIKDKDSKFYFAAKNTKSKLLAATAVSSEFIHEMMRESKSRRQLLIFDCCNSGAFVKGFSSKSALSMDTINTFAGNGRIVITSSDSMQYSFEEENITDTGKGIKSVFTTKLIEGIKTGEADRDKNGIISYNELYNYVYEKIIDERTDMTPTMSVLGIEGDLIVAKNPNFTKDETNKNILELISEGYKYFYTKNEYLKAIEYFEKILILEPKHTDIWILKGDSFFNLSKFDESIECYEKILEYDSNNNEVINKRNEAVEKLRITIKPTDTIEQVYNKINEATYYFDNEELDKAMNLFEKAIQLDPRNYLCYGYKGSIFFKQKKYHEALEWLDKSLEINPNNPRTLQYKGNTLYLLNRYDEAQQCIDKILTINPKDIQAIKLKDQIQKTTEFNEKARKFQSQGKYQEAIEWYDKVLHIDPNNLEALNSLKILREQLDKKLVGKKKEKEQEMDDKINNWLTKGIIFFNQGDYQQAIEYYNSILKIDPQNTDALDKRMTAQKQLDKKSTTQIETLKEKRKAIIIGIGEYESYEIPKLDGAENDAIEIRDRLVNYGDFKISNDHYLVGADATRKNILRAIGEIFRSAVKYDLVIFYFSGHGIPDEKTKEAFLAPYDYYPDDPFVSGINMADMKKAMYNAKNITNTIIILDCCYAGIATNDIATNDIATRSLTTMSSPYERETAKNVFAINVEELGKSSYDQSHGKIVLASSEATAVSREKNNCIHGKNDPSHSHGAFSYHLIEGLDGKAADPDTGIINIDSLKRYIEDQMIVEQRQKPLYSIASASNFDNIKIAISRGRFEAKIQSLINEVDEIFAKPYNDLIDIFLLQDAAKKVIKLISLKSDHPEIPRLKDLINKSLDMYEEPTINWLSTNMRAACEKINSISEYFYDTELPNLVYELSFDKLVTLSDSYIKVLFYITSHVRQNTIFQSSTDIRLDILCKQLRGVLNKNIL